MILVQSVFCRSPYHDATFMTELNLQMDSTSKTETTKDPENPLLGFQNNYGVENGENKKKKETDDDDGEEKDLRTWSRTMFDFCQNTTLHGLKQMTEHQPFFLRR